MARSESERIEAYIYHYLGLEPNEDQVSDNAYDRVAAAWRAYENGDLQVPDDWQPGLPVIETTDRATDNDYPSGYEGMRDDLGDYPDPNPELTKAREGRNACLVSAIVLILIGLAIIGLVKLIGFLFS